MRKHSYYKDAFDFVKTYDQENFELILGFIGVALASLKEKDREKVLEFAENLAKKKARED